MIRTPISLIILNSAPLVNVNLKYPLAEDALPLLSPIYADFLDHFCDVIERFQLRGAFSIIPSFGARGNIVDGIDSIQLSSLWYWLDIAYTRLHPYLDFGVEMPTSHRTSHIAVDIAPEESAAPPSLDACIQQISHETERLCQVGITPSGIVFPRGYPYESEHILQTSARVAFERVLGKQKCWYVLEEQNAEQGMPYRKTVQRTVKIRCSVPDAGMEVIENEPASLAYIRSLADKWITADGRMGQIIDILHRGERPILLLHWQFLYAGGRETGLRVLMEVANRIRLHLWDQVVWRDSTFFMNESGEQNV